MPPPLELGAVPYADHAIRGMLMTHPRFRIPLVAAGLMLSAAPAHAQAGRTVSFSKDVIPIFQKKCQLCHGADSRGGLKLDTYDNVMLGGTKGQDVIPGNPSGSRLIQLVEGRQMPPTGVKLTQIEVFVLRTWIQAGAKDDAGSGPAANAQKPLEIQEPKEGATVREKVRIAVPRESIPPSGFVAVYIDGRFKVALAPPSEEELQERKDKKLPEDTAVVYTWDTKAPLVLVQASSAAREDRVPADGPHVVEIRSYKGDGAEAETMQVQVNLKNQIEYVSNKPVILAYGKDESQVGKQWIVEHTVDLQASSGVGGARGLGAQATGGPDKISHKETSSYLVSLEDYIRASGTGFWRERRESPIVVTVDNAKKVVRLDTSSRYYSMEKTGEVRKTKVMEREKREPIVNPLDLPGGPQRMNETFTTNLRINLGAYIPATLKVDRLQATLEGIEWLQGEPCVRIRLTYLAGTAKVDILSANISNADFEIETGTSTIWFSETTNRVIKAEHDVTGNLAVDVSQLSGGAGMGGAPGGMGGEFGPGSEFGGAPMGGYPGGGSFGAPFGGSSGPPMGFGAPFGGGAPGGYPGIRGGAPMGGYPGSRGGAPMGGYPGSSGGFGAPGAPGGFGDPSGFGASGGFGGPGGFGAGADSGVAATIKRYHVNLKVNSRILPPAETKK